MEKRQFFRAATTGLGKYRTGGYGRIGVYRVKPASYVNFFRPWITPITIVITVYLHL